MKLGRTTTIIGGLIALAHKCVSWGNLGHRTIAYLAEKHFTEKGNRYATELLGGEDISDAAIWADEFKNTAAGRYTGTWHFVDAKDNPPLSCDVCIDRDCATNRTCIITAISNMTSQLEDPDLSAARRNQSFKFLLHLIGDLHNPLHAESISRGGNDIEVIFSGEKTNLHFVWDVKILLKLTQSNHESEIAAARSWAEKLFQDEMSRKEGHLHSLGSSPGLQGSSIDFMSVTQSEQWALEWASEANAWVCKYVLKDGPAALVGQELDGDYFEGAALIADELVSKAGRRLGMFVNALAVSRASKVRDVEVAPRMEL